MVKNLLSLALAGMALIAPSAMSAQVFTRTVPGASAPLQMVKPGALSLSFSLASRLSRTVRR